MFIRKNLRQEGQDAEDAAVGFLRQQGYMILARNYRVRSGEIDIIAREKDTICFIEVKMRRSAVFGLPLEAIPASKMRKLAQVAWHYLAAKRIRQSKSRFDVIGL